MLSYSHQNFRTIPSQTFIIIFITNASKNANVSQKLLSAWLYWTFIAINSNILFVSENCKTSLPISKINSVSSSNHNYADFVQNLWKRFNYKSLIESCFNYKTLNLTRSIWKHLLA